MPRPVIGLALLLASLLVANLALRHAGFSNSLQYFRLAVTHEAYTDSWAPMERALAAWDAGHPIYETVYFSEHQRLPFLYPLSSLLLPLSMRHVVSGDAGLGRALNRVGLVATLLFAACTLWLVSAWRSAGVARADRTFLLAMVLGSGIAALNFPLQMNYVLGQAQTLVNLGLAAALVLWSCRRPAASGVAVGVACLIKPYLALFLLWGLIRREWRFAAGIGITIAIGVAAAVWVFGLSENLQYWSVLSDVGQRGSGFYANQSVNGLLNRLVLPVELRHQTVGHYPVHATVLLGTLVTSLVLVMTALALPPRLRFSRGTLDFGIMGLSVTMAAPLAWDHNYAVLLPILAVAAGMALERRAAETGTLLAFAVAILVTGTLWEPLLAFDAPPANLLQSYVLIGGAVALVAMYRLGARTASLRPGD